MFTHKELVEKAYRWAKNRHRIVIQEKGSVYENPDIIAFSWSFSTLIEVKANRADFLRDKGKISRRNSDYCMGTYRLYCVPKGLVKEDEIPETWGLLEVYPSGYVKLKINIYGYGKDGNHIWRHKLTDKAHVAEKRMLYNACLRREKIQ